MTFWWQRWDSSRTEVRGTYCEQFNLDEGHTEVVVPSDSLSVESSDSVEELVYDTVRQGRRQRAVAYRYQKDIHAWTTVEDPPTDIDSERTESPEPERAMDQLAAAMAQLAQSQQQMAQAQQQTLAQITQSQQQAQQQQDQRMQQQQLMMQQQEQ